MKLLGKLQHKNNLSAPIVCLKDALILPTLVGTLVAPDHFNELVKKGDGGSNFIVAYPNTEGYGFRKIAIKVRLLQTIKMPDGSSRLIVEATGRVRIDETTQEGLTAVASYQPLPIEPTEGRYNLVVTELKTQYRLLAQELQHSSNLQDGISKSKSIDKLIGQILLNIALPLNQKIDLLTIEHEEQRLEAMVTTLVDYCTMLEVKKDIASRVKKKSNRRNREFYLQEQLKEINQELNSDDDFWGTSHFEERLLALNLPEEVNKKAQKMLSHLKKVQPLAPEAAGIRSYLDVLTELPWGKYSQDTISLDQAEAILDSAHYALKEPKEHILDYLSVRKIASEARGLILALVGPPGVGKTSIARSIAQALGRDFTMISLGGLRDEAELRGHSRTYLHSLPGKIIQNLQKTKSANPVFLLDEIDKISSSANRGDPSSVLLEILDPEQNKNFTDTYLELSFDLSQILFITTANYIDDIPAALRDRMEIIHLSGYTEIEKITIAQQFLIKKQLRENGLEGSALTINDNDLSHLVRCYTNESGVRNLEREIGRLIRRLITINLKNGSLREGIEHQTIDLHLDKKTITHLLGKVKYQSDEMLIPLTVGMAMGLAWTANGGVVLPIEAYITDGTGRIELTGKLGDVMKESAHIALSFIKRYLKSKGTDIAFLKKRDIHIHAPEGSVPKDGPSAGITMAAALYSALTGKIAREGVAMTGELTLSGQLLAIGGLKEKSLAAHRYHLKTVIISNRNGRDLSDIPTEILSETTFKCFDHASQALEFLFND